MPEAELMLQNTDSVQVTMRSAEGDIQLPIRDAKNIAVLGKSYQDEESAQLDASAWRDSLISTFTEFRIGADFGERAPQSNMSEAFKALLFKQTGRQWFTDVHGISILKVDITDPPPTFSRTEASGMMRKDGAAVVEKTIAARGRAASFTPQQRLAYDLYSGSFFQPSPDARFIMLAMALETLIEPVPREPAVIAHVGNLIAITMSTDLPKSERDSIKGTLGWLREESIGQAGKRLVKCLGDRLYMDGKETPASFFRATYEMRSALVHGHFPRPSRDEVGVRAANLELFLSDLMMVLSTTNAVKRQD